MRQASMLFLLPALLLAGCEAKIDADSKDDGNTSVVINGSDGQFSLDTSDFQAKLKLPKFAMDTGHMDIDGVKLYPGSKVDGVNVNAQDGKDGAKDEGKVTIGFASPDAPAKLLGYYRKAFADNGYTVASAAAGDMAVAASKAPDKAVRVALQPDGAGSKGTIVITGD